MNVYLLKLEEAEAIPLPYLLGLLRQLDRHPSGDWADISREFELVTPVR